MSVVFKLCPVDISVLPVTILVTVGLVPPGVYVAVKLVVVETVTAG
jgi:hypothetical protein